MTEQQRLMLLPTAAEVASKRRTAQELAESYNIEQGDEAVMHSFKYRKDLNFKQCNVVARRGERWLVHRNGESFEVKDVNLLHPQHLKEWMRATLEDTLDATLDAIVNECVKLCISYAADAQWEAGREAREARLAAEAAAKAAAEAAEVAAELIELGLPIADSEYDFTLLSSSPRRQYVDWLEMQREHRNDPSSFDDVPDRSCPIGGVIEIHNYDEYGEYDGPDYDGFYGPHPHYDYGYVARLGLGRVMWDLLRPLIIKRIKARNIAFYWLEKAVGEQQMHPDNIDMEAEAAGAQQW